MTALLLLKAFGGLLREYWKPIAAVLLVVGVGWALFRWGYDTAVAEAAKDEMKRMIAAAESQERLRVKIDGLGERLIAAAAERQVVTNTTIREVPKYVQPTAAACSAAGLHAPGFRVLHDATAAGVAPEAARVAAAPPVDPVAAASTIAANYGTCNEWRAQVIGWQEFWATTAEAFGVPAK